MRAPMVAFVIALGVGLLTGAAPAQTGAGAPQVGRPAAAVTAATKAKVPGRQIRIVLSGDRLGQRAMIRLVGVKGPVEGVPRVVKVKAMKRVKHLRPGRYRVVPLAIITAAGRVTATPVTVSVTAGRGATARITFRAIWPETITAGRLHAPATNTQ